VSGLSDHADFRKLWIGQTLSLAGTQFGALAFPLVAILSLHATPAQVGLLVGIRGLPWLVFGLFAGVAIDRLPRRSVLIVTDLGRGLLLGLVPAAALFGALRMRELYLVSFLGGSLTVFFETAYQSYLPSLVQPDRLVDASSKLAVSEGVTAIAGPSVAGFAIQTLSAPAVLGFDAISFLASGVSLSLIRSREAVPGPAARQPIWSSLRGGFVFLWQQSVVRAFMLSNATFIFFFTVIQVVLLLFFTNRLHLNPSAIGLIFAAGNVGALLGSAVAGRMGRWFSPGPTIIASSTLRAVGIASVPLAALAPRSAVPILITGQIVHMFGWSIWAVHQGSTRQLLIPDDMRGRVNGSFLFFVRGVTSLGGFAGGVLAARMGVVPTLVVACAGTLFATGWLLTSPVRRLSIQRDPTTNRRELSTTS
jgi:MFS family permease